MYGAGVALSALQEAASKEYDPGPAPGDGERQGTGGECTGEGPWQAGTAGAQD